VPHQPARRRRRARGKAASTACPFRGRPRTGTLRPVAGPGVYTWAERIGLCGEILAGPEPGSASCQLSGADSAVRPDLQALVDAADTRSGRKQISRRGHQSDLVPLRVSKAVGLQHDGEVFEYMVLGERDEDRCLVIQVGHAEAFELAASLRRPAGGPRPMTYQFTAAGVRSLFGGVREVRLDRIVDGAYAAPSKLTARRASGWSMLAAEMRRNLAVLADAPVLASAERLAECIGRQAADSAEAALLRRAVAADHPEAGKDRAQALT
jgi:bifunctional DNase/RNase